MKKVIHLGLMLLFMTLSGLLVAQQSPSDLWLNPATTDFETIRQTVEQYYADKEKGRGTGYKQWKRWEFFHQHRLTSDGKITNVAARTWDTYLEHKAQFDNGSRAPLSSNGYWSSIGPTTYTNLAGWNPGIGRLNVIAFHPTATNTFWVGGPSGGLWRTTNGGIAWTPLTDGMPNIGVSGIAINYNNTNVMYILTGDGDGGDTRSIGVLKTINGGETWLTTGLSWTVQNNVRGYKLLIHPTNPNTLFAVTTQGVFKTTNAGLSWTSVLSGSYRDIEFKPGDPAYVYVSGTSTFYRSTDTGENWTRITTGMPSGCTRIAIAVSPANSSYVYLFGGPATAVGSFKGFYLSTNSGGSFSTRSTTPNLLGYSSTGNDAEHQTTYDLAVAVSRTTSANVIVGGINTWTSSNWGTSWTITSWWDTRGNTIGYTHADIHDLAINPLNNSLYCLSDGGIFRSSNFGNTWTDITAGISITQWYRIAGTEANASLLIGGTQDNGSNKWSGGANMEHLRGADGMDCMIDHTNSNIIYTNRQNGVLEKSFNGGSTFTSIQPTGSSGTWVTPVIMNPNTATTIYAGYTNVYKTTNGGASWTNTGVNGSSAMAMGTSNTSRIYAASGTSIWRSDDAAATWTSVSSGLPPRNITGITVNPDNSLDVFITVADYVAGQKVYASSNGGASWTNISGNLPNTIINCIAYEDKNGSPDNALYIGTDIGVYYRDETLGFWIPFMNGLPTVPVFDLEINYTAGLIRAGTYGRGLWSSDLHTPCPTAYYLTQANDPGNPNYTGVQNYEASISVTSSRIITGGVGTDVTYKAGNTILLTEGFHAQENNLFRAWLGPCQTPPIVVTGSYAGQMTE